MLEHSYLAIDFKAHALSLPCSCQTAAKKDTSKKRLMTSDKLAELMLRTGVSGMICQFHIVALKRMTVKRVCECFHCLDRSVLFTMSRRQGANGNVGKPSKLALDPKACIYIACI